MRSEISFPPFFYEDKLPSTLLLRPVGLTAKSFMEFIHHFLYNSRLQPSFLDFALGLVFIAEPAPLASLGERNKTYSLIMLMLSKSECSWTIAPMRCKTGLAVALQTL